MVKKRAKRKVKKIKLPKIKLLKFKKKSKKKKVNKKVKKEPILKILFSKKKSTKETKSPKKEYEHYKKLKILSTQIFGELIDKKCIKYFKALKKPFGSADMDTMFRTYLAMMFLVSSLAYVGTLVFTGAVLLILSLDFMISLLSIIFIPITVGLLVFTYFYLYPSLKSERRKVSIETNLPFAINHMAAIAQSGAAPGSIFSVLAKFKEYGEISREAGRITRNTELFGLDVLSALKDVKSRSPSKQFKEFLEGMVTVIQTGGSMKKYLKEEARQSMFNYRINREKYTQMVSIYADFYTALLIAAPLVMITVLAILNMIGGTVFGLPTDLLIKMMVFVFIPLLNIMFLAFLQMTQPTM